MLLVDGRSSPRVSAAGSQPQTEQASARPAKRVRETDRMPASRRKNVDTTNLQKCERAERKGRAEAARSADWRGCRDLYGAPGRRIGLCGGDAYSDHRDG